MAKYKVKQGDCISSIAYKHGFFPDTLWNHAENANLEQKRKDLNVLLPGDEVFVPEKEEKKESCATEQKHRFRKKGVPAKMKVRLLIKDKPRANEPYTLEIDGELFSGTTDANGMLEHCIPPNANEAKLTVGKEDEQDEYTLRLGRIDPIDEITGVQSRLNNLGFNCGKADGVFGAKTEVALKEFQKKYSLPESGRADQATRNKLVGLYGC